MTVERKTVIVVRWVYKCAICATYVIWV